MSDTLLDVAEANVRTRGYNAISFRDLADQLGIKSASVHYHFRKKEDLGKALIQRYSQDFFEALNSQMGGSDKPQDRISKFRLAYRNALTGSDAICLCGMLGAESGGLPEAVTEEVQLVFQMNIDWLVDALPQSWSMVERTNRAKQILANLQGAMMLSVAMNDPDLFDQATKHLITDLIAD